MIRTFAVLLFTSTTASAVTLTPEVEKKTGDWSAILYKNEGSNRLFCALESNDADTVFRIVRYKDDNDTFLEILNPSWNLLEGRSKFSLEFEIKGENYAAELMGIRDPNSYYHDFTDAQMYAALLGMIAQATRMTVLNPNGSRIASFRARQSNLALHNFGDCLNSNWTSNSNAPGATEANPGIGSPNAQEPDAPRQLSYGTRVGMVVDVTSITGVDTSAAEARAVHTAANAKQFCVEYGNDLSSKCIADEMKSIRDGGFTGRAIANCGTGEFSTFFNQQFRFEGTSLDQSIAARYVVRDLKDDVVLDGSSASGYGPTMDVFSALCPSSLPVREF
jgi:hypothetical protein